MKHILYFLSFFLITFFSIAAGDATAAITPDSKVQSMLDQISQTTLWDEIGGISGVTPITVGGESYTLTTRYTYSGVPIEKATQYFYERCAAAGLIPQYHYWSGSIRNVICEKTGTTKADEIIIVGAHIDGIPTTSGPAADDNGTGTIAILRALELMAPYNFERTVRFVAFTGEEQTVLGSTAYADSVRGQNIVGMFNAEMMGWEGDGEPVANAYIRRNTSPGYAGDKILADTFVDAIAAYNIPIIPEVIADGMDQSDHSPFWDNNFSAVVISEDIKDDMNPYFHSAQDSRARLNMSYYTNMAKATIATAAHLAIPETASCIAPLPPANFSATALSGSSISLTWDSVPDAATYKVYRSLTPNGPYTLITSTLVNSYTNTGLAGNTTFYYVIRTHGTGASACDSANSLEASATTLTPPPAPVASFTLNPTTINPGESATLSWSTTDASAVSIDNGIGSVSLNGQYVVTPNSTTNYTLTATGDGGTITKTVSITVLQPVTAPTNLTSSLLTNPTQVRLTFRDNATNETGFVIERCTGSGCTNFVQIATAPARSNTGSVTFNDSAVALSTTYRYRVKAMRSSASSSYSNTISATTPTPIAIPNAPSNLNCYGVITSSTTARVICNWTDNSNNESGFEAQDSLYSDFRDNRPKGRVGANVTTIPDPNLARNTMHWFRVRAYNSAGNSTWSEYFSVLTP